MFNMRPTASIFATRGWYFEVCIDSAADRIKTIDQRLLQKAANEYHVHLAPIKAQYRVVKTNPPDPTVAKKKIMQ